MATKSKVKIQKTPGNGNGAGATCGGKQDVDLSKLLTPEQVALHQAGFRVLIAPKLKEAFLGEVGRTGENRRYLEKAGLREQTLRVIKNGRAVRYLLSEVLAEQERMIAESEQKAG